MTTRILLFVLMSMYLFSSMSLHLSAKEGSRKITGNIETKDGLGYVPERLAAGRPALVILDSRGARLLEMLKPALMRHGVMALIPKLGGRPGQANPSQVIMRLDGLLKHIVQQNSGGPGVLHAFGFSASTMQSFKIAFAFPKRFKSLIVAGGVGVNLTQAELRKGRGLPVLLVQGERDGFATPERGRRMQKTLEKGGVSVSLKIIPDAGHMDLVQGKASEYLRDLGGEVPIKGRSKQQKFPPLQTRWTSHSGAALACAPVLAGGRVIVLGTNGTLSIFDAQTGRSVRVFPNAVGKMGSGSQVRSGMASGDLVFFPIRSATNRSSDPDRIIALNLKTGEKKWEHRQPSGVFSGLGGVPGMDLLGYGSHSTHYHLLNAISGREMGKTKTGVSCASRGRFGKQNPGGHHLPLIMWFTKSIHTDGIEYPFCEGPESLHKKVQKVNFP